MTNKPMLSVERELLASFIENSSPRHASDEAWARERIELRALLDRPETPYVPKAGWSFKYVENGVIVIRNGEDWTIIKPGDGPIYEQFLYRFCEEQLNKTAAQHHGDPVAWQYRVSAGPATGWSLWHDGKGEEFKNSYQVETRPLYAEHPEPAADHTQCEECKGWGYHENHHEGGGTECGECGGSGNATVAVVMPERMKFSAKASDYAWAHGDGWNACIEELARLNGVKP